MSKRVTSLGVLALLILPMHACSSGGDDEQFTFGSSFTTANQTTYPTATTNDPTAETSAGDGDGDPSGDGDGTPTTTGDGDGSPTTTGDGDGDGCPVGQFGCPCDNGTCAPGLSCDPNTDTCQLGDPDPTTTTTTSTSTTGNGNDPWDPDTCMMPSIPVTITGLAGDMCSAPCVVDADCPPGPVGTAPQCALVLDMDVDPSQCALVCDPLNDACPVGASCKAIPNQPDVGICTYP